MSNENVLNNELKEISKKFGASSQSKKSVIKEIVGQTVNPIYRQWQTTERWERHPDPIRRYRNYLGPIGVQTYLDNIDCDRTQFVPVLKTMWDEFKAYETVEDLAVATRAPYIARKFGDLVEGGYFNESRNTSKGIARREVLAQLYCIQRKSRMSLGSTFFLNWNRWKSNPAAGAEFHDAEKVYDVVQQNMKLAADAKKKFSNRAAIVAKKVLL